jgi:hypothetical protein
LVAPITSRNFFTASSRSFGHELHQAGKKRPFAVHGVEALGLLATKLQHPHANDAKPGFLQHGENLARLAGRHSVGLDHRKSSFHLTHSLL